MIRSRNCDGLLSVGPLMLMAAMVLGMSCVPGAQQQTGFSSAAPASEQLYAEVAAAQGTPNFAASLAQITALPLADWSEQLASSLPEADVVIDGSTVGTADIELRLEAAAETLADMDRSYTSLQFYLETQGYAERTINAAEIGEALAHTAAFYNTAAPTDVLADDIIAGYVHASLYLMALDASKSVASSTGLRLQDSGVAPGDGTAPVVASAAITRLADNDKLRKLLEPAIAKNDARLEACTAVFSSPLQICNKGSGNFVPSIETPALGKVSCNVTCTCNDPGNAATCSTAVR